MNVSGVIFAAGALLSNNLVLILVLVNDNADAARVSFVSKSEESFADFRSNVGFEAIQALRYRICHGSIAFLALKDVPQIRRSAARA